MFVQESAATRNPTNMTTAVGYNDTALLGVAGVGVGVVLGVPLFWSGVVVFVAGASVMFVAIAGVSVMLVAIVVVFCDWARTTRAATMRQTADTYFISVLLSNKKRESSWRRSAF